MSEPKIIPMLSPADQQAGSIDSDSVDMSKLHKLTIVINLGAITGDSATFQLYAGATAGAKTTELPFRYQLTGADSPGASADVFGARTAVAIGGSGLVITAAAYNNRTIKIEVMSDQMTDGLEWLTLATDDGSASELLFGVIGVGEPRHSTDTGAPTAL